jgi:hypothetical protein
MVNVNKNLVTHGFEQKVQQAKAGAEKNLPQTTALELSGKEMTVAQVVADLAAVLAKYADLRDAEAVVAQKRALLHEALPGAHAEVACFKKYLEAKLGKGNPQLAEYGFNLGVRQPTPSGVKVLAAVKAKQTRAVRHTLGRRQRLALGVKGPSVLLGPDGKPVSVQTAAQVNPAEPVASQSGQGASPKSL